MPIHLYSFDRHFELIYSELNVHIYHYVHYSDCFLICLTVYTENVWKVNLGQHELHGYLEIWTLLAYVFIVWPNSSLTLNTEIKVWMSPFFDPYP